MQMFVSFGMGTFS